MIHLKTSIIISSLLLTSLLTACQSKNINYAYITTDSAPVTEVDKNTQAQLAQAAVSVDKSLQELSAIKIATHPQVRMAAPINPKQLGMEQISSIDWNGPIEPLLQKIATASHYKLKVLGVAPAIPILISINAQNEPLADILRDVTFQAQNKAGIIVYPGRSASTRIIELRYY
ncbi:MAG TPA: type IVB secretion system lipoprotein DotD [Coxiellaceae bacterium]|nr:type IVB secretion system lipoprotein DotD [Coxiellaceae bacterium]